MRAPPLVLFRLTNPLIHQSTLGPFVAYWEYLLDSAIQSSRINPGFGGGPLFDRRGRLLGATPLSLGWVGGFSLWKQSAEAVVRLGSVCETERLTIEVVSADQAEFYR